MIRRRLDRSTEFVAAGVESLSQGAAGNLIGRPRIDYKFDKHQRLGVEKEEDFVQPVDDLGGFVRTGSFEVPLFQRTKRGRIHEDTDEPARQLDQRVLPGRTSRENADVGWMFE
jgi:hypothetical protein